MSWTSSDLVTAVRRKARLSDDVNGANASLTDLELLALADEALESIVAPYIRRHRSEYYVVSEDFAWAPTIRIPSRAQGQSLRDVLYVPAGLPRAISLPFIPPEDIGLYNSSGGAAPLGFTIQGNNLLPLPTVLETQGTLRLSYYLRPSQLVPVSQADVVASDAAVGATTLTLVAPANVTWTVGQSVDLIYGNTPYEYITTTTVVGWSSPTLTVAALVAAVPSGAYVAPEGKSPAPQVPTEAFQLVVTGTTAKAFDALGVPDGAQAMYTEVERIKEGVREVIEPRVDGESQIIVNHKSPLRFGWGR